MLCVTTKNDMNHHSSNLMFKKVSYYGVVACTIVSHPSDPGSIPTVTNVENPFLLIVLG